MMASYIVKNRINTVEGLKEFKQDGYRFDGVTSLKDQIVFIREAIKDE